MFLLCAAAALTRDAILLIFGCVAAFIDLRTMTIPNELAAAGTVAGLLAGAVTGSLIPAIEGGILCFVLMLIIHLLGGLGEGDVKFAAVVGVFLGPLGGILALSSAFFLGGLAAVFLLLTGRASLKQPMPFAPCLLAGMVLTILL